ncbi:uncharacterized protein LOC117113481 [Anneissia japonica]|uniref:uncharacterized protein LOC117113481 n=1 Tax=Anneissia japonica TaxID=1529436 RepID=UPI001425A8F7|nr:uncharacterized protein LOC117113481 [Anneissia japonica]
MVKPTTVSNEGKDPIDKTKEELKANDGSVVVVTAITPTKPKPSKVRCKLCVVVSVAVVLLIVLGLFALKGCSERRHHDEDDKKHDMVFELDAEWHRDNDGNERYPDGDGKHGDKDGRRWIDWARDHDLHDLHD